MDATLFRQIIEQKPIVKDKDKDDFGILRKKARIARIGVHNYLDATGNVIRELIPEDELRAVDFSNTIITLDHPPKLVTADDNSRYQVGMTGQIDFNNGWLEGDVIVTSKNAINAIDDQHRYFSNAYNAELDYTPGIWIDKYGVMGKKGKGYPYDAIQRKIIPNHVAMVTEPRAGKKATYLNAQNSQFTIIHQNTTNSHSNVINMKKIVHGDEVYEIEGVNAQDVANLIKNMKKDYSALEKKYNDMYKGYNNMKTKMDKYESMDDKEAKKNNDLTEELDSLKGQKLALEARIKELEAQPKMNADQVNQLVTEKVQVWEIVKNSLEPSAIALNSMELKQAYLIKRMPELADKIKTESEGFINGVWEVELTRNKSASTLNDIVSAQRQAISNNVESVSNEEKSLEQLQKEFQEAQAGYFKNAKY